MLQSFAELLTARLHALLRDSFSGTPGTSKTTLVLRNSSPRAFQRYLTQLLTPRGSPFTADPLVRSTATVARAVRSREYRSGRYVANVAMYPQPWKSSGNVERKRFCSRKFYYVSSVRQGFICIKLESTTKRRTAVRPVAARVTSGRAVDSTRARARLEKIKKSA